MSPKIRTSVTILVKIMGLSLPQLKPVSCKMQVIVQISNRLAKMPSIGASRLSSTLMGEKTNIAQGRFKLCNKSLTYWATTTEIRAPMSVPELDEGSCVGAAKTTATE